MNLRRVRLQIWLSYYIRYLSRWEGVEGANDDFDTTKLKIKWLRRSRMNPESTVREWGPESVPGYPHPMYPLTHCLWHDVSLSGEGRLGRDNRKLVLPREGGTPTQERVLFGVRLSTHRSGGRWVRRSTLMYLPKGGARRFYWRSLLTFPPLVSFNSFSTSFKLNYLSQHGLYELNRTQSRSTKDNSPNVNDSTYLLVTLFYSRSTWNRYWRGYKIF